MKLQNKPTLAVTHPGQAHADDFLVACIIAAEFAVAIERREPNAGDIARPDTIVFDAGGDYNPATLNFDHHHNADLPCSLHLVLQALELHASFTRSFPWYGNVDLRDRKGPGAVAAKYGVTTEQVGEIAGPFTGALLRQFGDTQTVQPGDALYTVMAGIGRNLLEYAGNFVTAWAALADRQILEIPVNNGQDEIKMIINPSDDLTASKPFCRANGIGIIASHDLRGAGWAIMRVDECLPASAMVDFNLLRDDPAIAFVHASGFICKTTDRFGEHTVAELAKRAIAS